MLPFSYWTSNNQSRAVQWASQEDESAISRWEEKSREVGQKETLFQPKPHWSGFKFSRPNQNRLWHGRGFQHVFSALGRFRTMKRSRIFRQAATAHSSSSFDRKDTWMQHSEIGLNCYTTSQTLCVELTRDSYPSPAICPKNQSIVIHWDDVWTEQFQDYGTYVHISAP